MNPAPTLVMSCIFGESIGEGADDDDAERTARLAASLEKGRSRAGDVDAKRHAPVGSACICRDYEMRSRYAAAQAAGDLWPCAGKDYGDRKRMSGVSGTLAFPRVRHIRDEDQAAGFGASTNGQRGFRGDPRSSLAIRCKIETAIILAGGGVCRGYDTVGYRYSGSNGSRRATAVSEDKDGEYCPSCPHASNFTIRDKPLALGEGEEAV